MLCTLHEISKTHYMFDLKLLTNSKGCHFSLHSSSRFMLWSNMLAIKIFKMIIWSCCQQGLAIMWKWNCNTPNTCSTSFLQDSCEVTKWFPPPRVYELFIQQSTNVDICYQQAILSIFVLINHESHIKPNSLQEISNKRTMIKKCLDHYSPMKIEMCMPKLQSLLG